MPIHSPEREADPEEERDRAKEALTELFSEAKNNNEVVLGLPRFRGEVRSWDQGI